jgi:hypothetical protein
MSYWIDLFTGTTWDEFRAAGGKVSGFRARMQATAKKVQPGDIFLCYLIGVMRWVGILKVLGKSHERTRIWQEDEFPVRFDVESLVLLDPERGLPMDQLEGQVGFFSEAKDRGKFKGVVRGGLRLLSDKDGEVIFNLVNTAATHPVTRPVDPRKLARRALYKAEQRRGKTTIPTVVSVPDSDEPQTSAREQESFSSDLSIATTWHTEIQYRLLNLGAEIGMDIWVAKNDRTKVWDKHTLGTLPRLIAELPTQFNDATNRTIELIDVLWLKGNSIIAAFEVECTTSVYSGLLRMSGLLALQPNLDIKLYLVAPDDRRNKVEQEILRPTFALRERPLPKVCGFLPFSTLMDKIEGIRKLRLAKSLKPDFLERTAEFFDTNNEEA